MKKLHEIYRLYPDDTLYHHKLKLRLREAFSEKNYGPAAKQPVP